MNDNARAVEVEVKLTTWDAREIWADGFDQPATAPDDLSSLLEKIGHTIATEGTVVVLPGLEPQQAVVITMAGAGNGHVVTGSTDTTHL